MSKSFPGVKANEDISLSVEKSQIHALLGENGAGKSTLVKIFYGLLQPDKGEMLLKGFKYQPKNPKHARSSGIGMVFQHFSLFEPLTVLENILLGLDLQENKTEVEKNVNK
ncbi:MAG: ABC transporter, partial [Rhodobacteraceae bacterium]